MKVHHRLFAILMGVCVAFCVTSGVRADLSLPAGSAIYDDLEHFRALGLWRGGLEMRPLPLKRVAAIIREIERGGDDLTGGDRLRLRDLKRTWEQLHESMAQAPERSGRGEGSADPFPPSTWNLGLGIQYFGTATDLDSIADLDRRPRRDGMFTLQLEARVGRYLGAELRFYEDYSRLTPQPLDRWVDNAPVDLRGTTTDPSARLDRAVLSVGGEWFEIRYGREDRRLGQGRWGSLFLSENPFPLDGLALGFETRFVAGSSLVAQNRRGGQPPWGIPVDGEPFIPDYANGDAWIAAHRIEIRPPGPATFGLYEAAAWGGRGVDLAYANPIGFLVAMTQDVVDRSGTDDKKVLGIDFRLDLPPVTIYGEFLLDRLVTLDAASSGDGSGISSFAQLIGLRWANPLGLTGADLDLEYAHLDPQVYFHHDSDPRRALLTEDLIGEGSLIGHWLGPNSDGLFAALRLPSWGGLGRGCLEFQQLRWGIIDGMRGRELGFVHLTKAEKGWITGSVARERIFRLGWEKRGWRPGLNLPGRLDLKLDLARVERSGIPRGGGWQLDLRLNWFVRRLVVDPGE